MIDTKGTLYQDLTKILVTRDQIAEKVRDLGRVLTERYQGKSPVMVCILKGAATFLRIWSGRLTFR
jgi:hypoxanthine phosphoribosyltransferase